MAMMISRFHKLIQSRILWLFILVIIVFSFVIWGMQWPSQKGLEIEANSLGMLDGQHVTREEFNQAYANTYLSVCMMVGRPIRTTPKIDEDLRKNAWRRLAELREAKKLGFEVSNEDVVLTIQNQPFFLQQGRFDPSRYQGFVENFLRNIGFGERQFEEHIREEIMLQRMRNMLSQAVLIAPYEMQRTFATISDVFDIDYVAITASNVAAGVAITDDDAEALFAEDPKAFTLPPKMQVKYVRFAVADFPVTEEIDDMDALDYYNDHIDDFTTLAPTNETAAAAASNLLAQAGATVTTPFEEVKTNIVLRMLEQAARDKAADAATDFVVDLAPDRLGRAPDFDQLAHSNDLEMFTTPFFSVYDEVDGVEAGKAFNEAAFALRDNADDYFTDAIVASNFVYVAAFAARQEERVPEFKEIAEQAREAALARAEERALARKAGEVMTTAEAGIERGESFAKAVAAFDLPLVQLTNTTVATGFETNAFADVLIPAVLAHNQGELVGPVTNLDTIIVGYVARRAAGDTATFTPMRPQIVEALRRERSKNLYGEWQDYLLRAGKFEEKATPELLEEELEAEEEDLEAEAADATADDPAATPPDDPNPAADPEPAPAGR